MKNLLTPSIEKRATELMLNGLNPIEAVKQALVDENNLIGSLIDSANNLSDRGVMASNFLFKKYIKL